MDPLFRFAVSLTAFVFMFVFVMQFGGESSGPVFELAKLCTAATGFVLGLWAMTMVRPEAFFWLWVVAFGSAMALTLYKGGGPWLGVDPE